MNVLTNVAAALAVVTALSGAVYGIESRYVSKSEYQDLEWLLFKRELRELEQLISEADNPKLRELYRLTLEKFCRRYPGDAECRGR